jgi:hypothetical protein
VAPTGAAMPELDDEGLLAALAEVLAADEPLAADRAALVEHEAYAFRRLDAALAELRYDTAADEPVGVRGSGVRSLSFEADGHELDVELQDDDTIVGQVSPPDVEVSVEGPAGEVAVEADRLGRFLASVPGSRLRVLLSKAVPAWRVVTPWIFR